MKTINFDDIIAFVEGSLDKNYLVEAFEYESSIEVTRIIKKEDYNLRIYLKFYVSDDNLYVTKRYSGKEIVIPLGEVEKAKWTLLRNKVIETENKQTFDLFNKFFDENLLKYENYD